MSNLMSLRAAPLFALQYFSLMFQYPFAGKTCNLFFYLLVENYFKKYLLFCGLLLFTLALPAQPVITSFNPTSGAIGTTVTIAGRNFSSVASSNIVFFGAVRASIVSATPAAIEVKVPAGASHQPITVTNNNLTAYSDKPFIVTFPGGENAFTSGSFAVKIGLGTADNNPWYTTPTDFDEDGKPDIAFISEITPHAFSIFKNNSTPNYMSFSPRVNFPLIHGAGGLAAGDLDGDGKPDIAFSSVDNGILVFRNNSIPGTISFEAEQNFEGGYNGFGICLGDLDNDGRPDIAVANYYDNFITVFKNTSTVGNISFSKGVIYEEGISTPQNLSIRDLDADGWADIVVTNVGSNTIAILKNISSRGNIAFESRMEYKTGEYPRSVSISDFDNDGKPDIAITSQKDSTVSIFKNNSTPGNINFNLLMNLKSGNGPYGIAVDDLNGDGLPDIVASNGAANTVSVFRNKSTVGTISFSSKTDFITHMYPDCVYTADFDGDGKPDLSLGCPGESYGEVSVLKNKVNEPAIFSFSPVNASRDYEITIKGSNYTSASSVTFGGVAAKSFKVLSDSEIIAVVDTGRTGDIAIVNKYGSAAAKGFTFTPPPSINYFTPISAGQGQTITIVGANLSNTSAISFGGISATSFYVNSPNTVTAVVGNGASGNIRVTTIYGADSLAGFNFVPPPTITSFNPANAGTGDTVTIIGTNLTSTKTVLFGNTSAASFLPVSASKVIAIVAQGASGNVTLTTNGGTVTANGFTYICNSFAPIPSITSLGDTILVSSVSRNYQWYYNNNKLIGETSRIIRVKKVGFYRVENSSNQICWYASNDYPLLVLRDQLQDSLSMQIYPNPAVGMFNVVITLPSVSSVVASVSVINPAGNVVLQTEKLFFFSNQIRIPISLNATGVHNVKVTINGAVKTQSVILQ
jgi:hypothetical protein